MIHIPITLDLAGGYVQTIRLVQYEKDARSLDFSILSKSAAYNLSGFTVRFCARKPSGAELGNSCTITDAVKGKVSYVVTEQTAIEAGTLLDARLELVASGITAYSFPLPVEVAANHDYTTAAQSTSEFTALEQALALVSGHEARITTAESDIDALQASMGTAQADIDALETSLGYAALIGEIKIWPKSTAPTKYLLCDGSLISRTTYAALFTLIGTAFGAGDGSTTFALPNLKKRIPVGQDTSDANFDVVGETGGSATHTHTTTITGGSYALNTAGPHYISASATDGVSSSAFVSSAGSSYSPYIVLNYIIRAIA